MTSENMPSDRESKRRFLVADFSILTGDTDFEWIDQSFLLASVGYVVRIHTVTKPVPFNAPTGGPGILTVTGPREGTSRFEQEMQIPHDVATGLLGFASHRVCKRRYTLRENEQDWIIYVFEGNNAGLIIAEIDAHDTPEVKPPWCGAEITHDRRFDDVPLSRQPYRSWPMASRTIS